MLVFLACSTMLAASGPDAPTPEVAQAYREERARAGRSSADQVRLALWCEARGLTRERLNHLAQAVLSDPANATARGLMGLVAYEGRFLRPEAVAERSKADPILAEYDARRAKAPYTAEGQWAMGVWAEDRGLKDQARAHFTAVTRLNPSRDGAWKRLGYKKQGGRWVTDDQLAAEKAEADAQKQANKIWRAALERYRAMLDQPPQRAEAEVGLASVTDPRAVPMIGLVFDSPAGQARAVQMLGQIDSPGSSRALAFLAVTSATPDARRLAIETLRRRDPREYAGLLIALIRDPIRYEVKPVGGPGSPGVLFVEGERYDIRRVYEAPALPRQFRIFSDDVPFEPFSPWNLAGAGLAASKYGGRALGGDIGRMNLGGLAEMGANPNKMVRDFTEFAQLRDWQIGLNVMEVQRAAAESSGRLTDDVRRIEAENARIREDNERVYDALTPATAAKLPRDRKVWAGWYTNQLGYASRSSGSIKPVFDELITGDQPNLLGVTSQPFTYDMMSCFGAGTPVQTAAGPRPIEALKVGDRVLTQSTATGALGYQPILVTHHNPPSPTFRVKLGGEAIVSSHFHRFWVAGRGWVMARELKPGDPIRALGAVLPVESVEADAVQPVFNLDVAGDADFFAGQAAALVHDNTLPDPRLVPFDATPPAAVVSSRGE